jgi:DNA-binding response OmpR family regulator
MTNILVAEDNEGLRRLIGIHLRRAGYQVTEADDGLDALDRMEHSRVHLIVTDVMMPRLDGYGLVRELRSAGDKTPVLMLTVKDTLEDKRTGFHAGADDYLTKPVDFEELLLRVEALLRRCGMQQERLTRVGGCTLHADTLLVTGEGYSLELRPREFALLEALLHAPQKIFTRQMLMDELWGYDSESDPRTVDTHIRRLREKLAAVPDFEIQTVRGLGYRAVVK